MEALLAVALAETKPVPEADAAVPTEETGQCGYQINVDPDLADIINDYIKALKLDCRNLVQAYKKKDFKTMYGIGHDLKGSGSGYGLDRVTELGQEICELAKNNETAALAENVKQFIDFVKNVRISSN